MSVAISWLLIQGLAGLDQAPILPSRSVHPSTLSYETALTSLPPRSRDCPAFHPVLPGDIRIKSKPENPPMLPILSIAQGDDEVVVQICVDKSGTPISAIAICGPLRFRLSFERYCMQLRFDPYEADGSPQDVTLYMPFRFSVAH
ncbi:MAG: hypothetical protein HY014_16675 [Acidobacteria bacterium]|nr:hypothetical protein [Acidobacteriota bacterium]MBI3489766.1 hypothetical protein [Acidobacteriota bacterium]